MIYTATELPAAKRRFPQKACFRIAAIRSNSLWSALRKGQTATEAVKVA
jgi:hypothetical protein